MGFEIKKAKREKINVKVALMAPSGGGKTYGALRLATGMANEIEKETGVSSKTICYYRKSHNLPTKFNYSKISKIDNEEFEKLFN